MENLLAIWIEDLNQKRIPVDTATIKQKAIRIYNEILHQEPSTSSSVQQRKNEFSASGGWFSKFLERHGFHNLKTKGEIASADIKAAEDYLPKLAKIIEEGGYTPDQVFNADETGLFWKRLPTRTYVSKAQKSVGGFKVAKDRVTFLLCSNASGDRMLKPLLVNKNLRPRALKGKDLMKLPVHWVANKKAWVTAAIFKNWFEKCFVPEVKRYLKEKKQTFKVLLIIDNAPGHPVLNHPNVQVIFLPPNTTSIIQPLDQGIISMFKMYYLKKTFQCILEKMENDKELDFSNAWKQFSILNCITHATAAIAQLRSSTLNACWKPLWPACVVNEGALTDNDNNYDEIISLARSVGGEGFEDMTREDLDEILIDQMLDEEDLFEIASINVESSNSSDELEEELPLRAETIKDGLKLATQLENYFLANDPNSKRARKFQHELKLCMMGYKELHKELLGPEWNRSNQRCITEFVVKSNPCSIEQHKKFNHFRNDPNQESLQCMVRLENESSQSSSTVDSS